MQIPIASDHGGYALKQFLLDFFTGSEMELIDMGTHSEESVDYPDFIHPLAKAVNDGQYEKGIIICGSGQGASMTANKYPFVRAALLWDQEQTALTRQHNDANIIALPGRFIDFHLSAKLVQIFMETPFEGGRHQARIDKIRILLK